MDTALMRSETCTTQFVNAMEAVLGVFKFSYPLTDKNLNMDQLWEVYTAVFDLPITATTDTTAPALDFAHVAHAQALIAASHAAAHWRTLPVATVLAQRLLRTRIALPLPALISASQVASALLRARAAAPAHAAVVAAAAAARTAASQTAAALLRAHRDAQAYAAASRVAAADTAAALLLAHRERAAHSARCMAAAQTQALARAQTEQVLHALTGLCAVWAGALLAGARAEAVFARTRQAAARAQGVWCATRTQQAQRALVRATEHVQAALADAKRAREEERERQQRYAAECARLRDEQRAALENDELARLVRPHTRPQWVADKDAAKCHVCCQPFSSSNRRVCFKKLLLMFWLFVSLLFVLAFSFSTTASLQELWVCC